MNKLLRISLLVTILLLLIAILGIDASDAADQGCVNQGSDRRMAASVVCGMQQKLSWKSEHLPHLFRIGSARRTHVEIAWPPYVVFNKTEKPGHWLMFRLGFRYDRTWHGYIFPTAALKSLDHPLQY